MMTMPEELAITVEDVKRAKREIQEAGRARTKIRKPAKKTWKSRLVTILNFFGIRLRSIWLQIFIHKISFLRWIMLKVLLYLLPFKKYHFLFRIEN